MSSTLLKALCHYIYRGLIRARPRFRMKFGAWSTKQGGLDGISNACGDESYKPWPWRSSSSRQRC